MKVLEVENRHTRLVFSVGSFSAHLSRASSFEEDEPPPEPSEPRPEVRMEFLLTCEDSAALKKDPLVFFLSRIL